MLCQVIVNQPVTIMKYIISFQISSLKVIFFDGSSSFLASPAHGS